MRSVYMLRLASLVVAAITVCGCAALHLGPWLQRPPALVADWIDLSHTSASDTALWVLRGDGYDGAAHILVERDSGGVTSERRTESQYGRWYLRSSLTDESGRAICFARRLGRDGATCLPFSLDTISTPAGPVRRLWVRGYPGEHRTGNRELIERRTVSDAHRDARQRRR